MNGNAALVQKGFDAFAAGDLGTLDGLFADTAVWHVAGRGPHSGDYAGKEAIFGYFGRLMEESDGTFHNDVIDILGASERAVALTTIHAERAGKHLDADGVVSFTIADDHVTEAWSGVFDQYAVDEFWSA